MTVRRLVISVLLPAFVSIAGVAQEKPDYRPTLAVPDAMAPFLKHLEPGSDGFPLERQATELDARLRELSRFDKGFMFSGFWVWSKALGINSTDFSAGVPNQTKEQTRALDYSLLDYDRPHNITLNAIYQTPSVTQSKALGLLLNEWQISGVYRWTSGRPYGVGFSIPGIGAQNLTGTDGNPNARIVLTCDPGNGYSGDPYQQLDTSCFAPPKPGSDGNESARFFVRAPPINNVDMSFSKNMKVYNRIKAEVRVDMFNALNHTQFTGVNATANFASLTDKTITNLPYDASGALVRPNGFGTINGVAPPRTLQLVTRVTF
jgi:hypothetical protein